MRVVGFLALVFCVVSTSAACTPTTPTCFDGIKNSDETAIDCGGATCEACAFAVASKVPLVTNGVCALRETNSNPTPLSGSFNFVPNPPTSSDPLEPGTYSITVNYAVSGLTDGDHKFHVHNWGDVASPDGFATEMHFVGVVATGSRAPSLPQEVGLLNNDIPIQTDNSQAAGSFTDSEARLNSQNSILGRAMIVHGNGQELSTTRAAQCVIGLKTISGDLLVDDAPTITRAACALRETSNNANKVTGLVEFKLNAKNKIDTRIYIAGLDPSLAPYSIYVYEKGDLTVRDGSLTGTPFVGTLNPVSTRARIGELGGNTKQYTPTSYGVVGSWFTDGYVALNGVNSIVGRSIVVGSGNSSNFVNKAACVIGLTEGYGRSNTFWTAPEANITSGAASAPLTLRAVAVIQSTIAATTNVTGFISFYTLEYDHPEYPGGYVKVKYLISGLAPGSTHDFAIATLGNAGVNTGQVDGSTFGPPLTGYNLNGARAQAGYLGNITADSTGIAQGVLYDFYIMLNNYNSIVGKAALIYAAQTDSAPIAWGIVGIEAEDYTPRAFDPPKVTQASCLLQPLSAAGQPSFNGTVSFTQVSGSIAVAINIPSAASGTYNMHVHSWGDIQDLTSGNSVGPHFNGVMAGPRTTGVCEVGLLNNGAAFSLPTTTAVTYNDNIITFSGINNIIGRALIVHNASNNARVATCVIGVVATDTQYSPDPSQIPPAYETPTTPTCQGVECIHGKCDETMGICICDNKWSGSTCAIQDSAASQIALSSSLLFITLLFSIFLYL